MPADSAQGAAGGVSHGGAVGEAAAEPKPCALDGCERIPKRGRQGKRNKYCCDLHRWRAAAQRKRDLLEVLSGEVGREAVVAWLVAAGPDALRSVVGEVRRQQAVAGWVPAVRPAWRDKRRDVYVPDRLWYRVRERARRQGIAFSEVVRQALEALFRAEGG